MLRRSSKPLCIWFVPVVFIRGVPNKVECEIPTGYLLHDVMMVCAASRMLCEPSDVGYNCDFAKSSKKRYSVQDILDSLSRSIAPSDCLLLAPSDRLLSATAVDLYLSYRSDKGSFTASLLYAAVLDT